MTVKIISLKTDELLISFNNREHAIRFIENILYNICNYSLISELNNLQIEATGIDGSISSCLENKWDIPDYFINLIISKFNLKIITNKED